MEQSGEFSFFTNLVHPNFDTQTFRSIFIKAAWKVYTESVKNPVPIKEFQLIIVPLFDALFFAKEKKILEEMKGVHNLLQTSEAIEPFLSDVFYIVLSYYVKSFYGTGGEWGKIIAFTNTIERFIAYVVDKSGHDETLFIFEDTLINALETLRQHNEPIMVLNTYYGVPIQYKAKIVHTDTQSVIIKTHPIQETAALLQNGIYLLKNGQFVNDVYAAVSTKMINGERFLELNRFDQLETSLFHRQSIRVQPSKPFDILLTSNGTHLKFELFDISLGGLAAIGKELYPLAIDSNVILHFPQEVMGHANAISGKFIFKSSYESGYKYHFKMNLTPQQEDELGKYIAKREHEIIKMLRDEIV
ncbi:MAG: PilZ domain-containing protein [Sulfuricurvum sp.]|jgi:c-di-GMP-binding flagellar brake protein YcgR|uniref:PilZ domain-containing protein n=1 Tax=Sulfuricurvum sp. TaxID=2025608 RepID=UPI0025CE1501|nr:PilZ domain-containing protein [Sulfuricurvum sp.]MCK9372959.1 PilZ domain-containing protein [Sulfuricurvum sp.]